MKVKERQGVKAGSYVGKFQGLVKPGNKVGLKKTSSGKSKLMFRIKAKNGADIPYSITWGDEDYKIKPVFGALGVSYDSIKETEKSEGLEEALLKFERKAKEKDLEVSVYVRDDNGWGSGIKPFGVNSYTVRFKRITTRDESGKARWVEVPSQDRRNPKTGGTYKTDPWNKFTVALEIVAGERKGAVLTYNLAYPIAKDEDDEWILDAETGRGQEFKNFLLLHRVAVDSLNPDRDFEDPTNGLPELEKRLLKRETFLTVSTNADGWIDKIDRLPEGVVIQDKEVDEGTDYASTLIPKLFSLIDKKVRQLHGKSAWSENGKMTKVGFEWFKEEAVPFLRKRGIKPDFKTMQDDDVTSLIDYIKAS